MEIASLTSSLAPLAFLACPVGMGLMMWMMARGSKSAGRSADQTQIKTPDRPASVEVLREEHRRLGEEIERLEGQRSESGEAAQRR